MGSSTAYQKYMKSNKGKQTRSRCNKIYYDKNKTELLNDRKSIVECIFCMNKYNKAYLLNIHLNQCIEIN